MEEFSEKHGVYTHHAWGMTETGPLGVLNTLKPGMSDLPKNQLDTIKLKQRRPKWWIREDAVFVDEIPHTATGKISKKDLRVQFANYQSTD